jgi:Protein of unknown function (DUF3025)
LEVDLAQALPAAHAHPALHPLWTSYCELARLSGEHRIMALNERADAVKLENSFGQALRFQSAQGSGKAVDYEWAIAGAKGCVPAYIDTRLAGRDGDHDLLNALIWLNFPKTKACLNRLQAEEIAPLRGAESGLRSTRRDQITLFDENGAILLTQDHGLVDLLERRDWQGLFVTRRSELLAQARLIVVGHGLLQKCLCPFKAMTARIWVLPLTVASPLALVDETLAISLSANWPVWPKRLLPIAGWPDWSEQLQDETFYQDRSVFRK